MKIELKNLKVNLQFSEETTLFKADVFVNGIKVGYADNDGHGGCTNIRPYEGKMPLLMSAYEYARTLPNIIIGLTDSGFTFPSSLDWLVDDIVTKHCIEKTNKATANRLKKHTETCIAWGVPNSGKYTTVGYKQKLSQVVKTHLLLVQDLLDRTRKGLKDGEEILNTNLAELGLK